MIAEKITQCPRCESNNLQFLIGDDEPTNQYGRVTCGDCGRFIQWLRDPALTTLVGVRSEVIRLLLSSSEFLPSHDRDFLRNIAEVRWLSDAREYRLAKIYDHVSGCDYPDELRQDSIKNPSKMAEGV